MYNMNTHLKYIALGREIFLNKKIIHGVWI